MSPIITKTKNQNVSEPFFMSHTVTFTFSSQTFHVLVYFQERYNKIENIAASSARTRPARRRSGLVRWPADDGAPDNAEETADGDSPGDISQHPHHDQDQGQQQDESPEVTTTTTTTTAASARARHGHNFIGPQILAQERTLAVTKFSS